MPVDVPLKGLGAVLRADARQRAAFTQAAVLEAAMLGAEVVAQAAPKDMGNLKRSVRAVQVGQGAEIVVDAPQAVVMELGARPHWTPIEPLIAWAKRHAAAMGVSDDEAEGIAYAVQKKIATVGTAPRWYVRGNLPKLRRILEETIRRRLG